MAQPKKFLVGVDGSDHSRAALRWAIDEARHHGGEVEAVSAWSAQMPVAPPDVASPRTADMDQAEYAGTMLREVVSEVVGDATDVTVRTETVEGSAAKVLIDRSANAEVLVVGSRGHGGFAGMVLGSVSQQVAMHARCTVVVVR